MKKNLEFKELRIKDLENENLELNKKSNLYFE